MTICIIICIKSYEGRKFREIVDRYGYDECTAKYEKIDPSAPENRDYRFAVIGPREALQNIAHAYCDREYSLSLPDGYNTYISPHVLDEEISTSFDSLTNHEHRVFINYM